MTERTEPPRTLSTAIPAIPVPTPSQAPATATEDDARARVVALEREARAMGAVPAAALLFHEMGLLWEGALRHPRNAAVAYQQAFKLAPKFLANIRAARRLFAEVGNWAMVVQLLDAEINATEARRGRAALLFEKAQVLEQRLSKEPDAMACVAQSLALEPQDVTLLVQLEQVYTEKADFDALVKVFKLLAQSVSEDAARAQYLTSAGLLLEDRLKDQKGAASLFRQAFTLDRRDPQLLAAMKRVAQREGTADEELAALAAEAEGQGALAAPTFLQISKAYERLGRPEDALAALLAARRVSPGDPLILSELARIYESRTRFEELAEVLSAWVQQNNDENEVVAINLRLASLYEEQLKRDGPAADCYRAILKRVPGNATALAGLGKLAYRSQDWLGLLQTYEAEAEATDDPRHKAGRVYKAGETLEERLGRTDDAIARYAQCLQLSPGFLPAQKALVRLYEKHGRWSELVSMYESDLMQTTDREQQISTLNKIAALHEDRLNDVTRAIECLKRVLDLSPDHLPTMRNLGRLYERAGLWPDLLALNEQEARLAADTKQVVSLAHRNAEILEENVRDRPAAIAAWERVLQLSPNYMPALRSLGRLYGQDGRWDSLINMYRAEAEIASSTDQAAALIHKIGELYEQKLKNENDAIASYREVLTLAPSHSGALRALARIYRAQAHWESLIEILHAEAANRTDPTERSNAMFQAAAIWEDQLGRVDRAIEGYQEVLRLAPNHTTALQQLERLLTAKDDVKELIVLLDRQTQAGSPASRVAAWLKLARLYIDRLNEPARAATCCESALGLETSNLSALRMLERIRASDKPRRAELRARIAEVIGDSKLAAAIRFSSQDNLDPHGRPSDAVIEQLKAAFNADPTDEALGLVLERAMHKAADARGLISLYERRRQMTTDSSDLLQLLLRIADLHENHLGEVDKAAVAYSAALQSAADLYPALQGLVRCCLKSSDFAKARTVLDSVSNSARDQGTIIAALMESARIAKELQNDVEGAAVLYRRVLERDPLHVEAGHALEELLARRGGATDLVQLHQKRGDVKVAQKDMAAAAKEYFQAAKIALDQVRDRPGAMMALDKALMAMPTHAEGLELKASLAFEDRNFGDAAAAYAVRVQQGGEPRHLAQLHLKLAAIYGDQLGDQTRAAAHLQTTLAGDPTNPEALDRLANIHITSRNWTGAADCLRRLLDLGGSGPARVRHTLALARVTDEGFGDVPQAIVLYRRALELNPGDSATLDRLVALYERTGAVGDLIVMLEQQAQQAHEVKKAVALKLRIGALYAKIDDVARAIAAYRQIIDVDAQNINAYAALAEIYARDTGSVAMAIETHRNLLKIDPTRVDSLHALFKTWESLRQFDKAFCAASLLAFFKSANEVELAFFSEARNRLPSEFRGNLAPPDLVAVHHANARNAAVDVLRAIGDQLVKISPPQLEVLGIDKKADRLKPDHAVSKAVLSVTQLFATEPFDVYQGKRGLVTLETTEPPCVIVNPDIIRRFNIREQRFLFGRAALALSDKAAVVRKASFSELADLIGNSVRIHQPNYMGIGRRNDEQSKQLRKAYSRKALKVLEEPADAVAASGTINIDATIQALSLSQDRAGLVVCADPSAALSIMVREEAPPNAPKADTQEGIFHAVRSRADVRELLSFALSDEFFRLRQRVGVSLG